MQNKCHAKDQLFILKASGAPQLILERGYVSKPPSKAGRIRHSNCSASFIVLPMCSFQQDHVSVKLQTLNYADYAAAKGNQRVSISVGMKSQSKHAAHGKQTTNSNAKHGQHRREEN